MCSNTRSGAPEWAQGGWGVFWEGRTGLRTGDLICCLKGRRGPQRKTVQRSWPFGKKKKREVAAKKRLGGGGEELTECGG